MVRLFTVLMICGLRDCKTGDLKAISEQKKAFHAIGVYNSISSVNILDKILQILKIYVFVENEQGWAGKIRCHLRIKHVTSGCHRINLSAKVVF